VAFGLKSTENVQPEPPSEVFAGNPVLLFGETKDSSDAIELSWDGGQMSLPIPPGELKRARRFDCCKVRV
jgi:hypothetical protein